MIFLMAMTSNKPIRLSTWLAQTCPCKPEAFSKLSGWQMLLRRLNSSLHEDCTDMFGACTEHMP